MPIIQSAKKALRGSRRKRVFNLVRKDALKKTVKEVRAAATAKGADAKTLLSKAYQAIDKAAKRGIIKANTAARKKSRLAALLKKVK